MEKINLRKEDISLLKELYLIYSPSEHEGEMSAFIQKILSEMSIKFETDESGQIFSLKEKTPLLAAHMDQVSSQKLERIWHHNNIIVGTGNLGADDKNGIFILLKLIWEFRDKVSFIFSVCEEKCSSSDGIDRILSSNKKILKEILYGLVFDRRNGSDIIGLKNDYCVAKFDSILESIGKDFGFNSTTGSFSDCNAISKYISCANFSCGYYNPHSSNEVTVITELENSLNFGRRIISEIKEKFDPPKKTSVYTGGGYFHYHTAYNKNYNGIKHTYFECAKCNEIFTEEEITETSTYSYVFYNMCPVCGGNLKSFLYENDNDNKNKKLIKRKFKFTEELNMLYCKTCKKCVTKDTIRVTINKKGICNSCGKQLVPCTILLKE